MKYLIKIDGRWYFKRRVPEIVKEFDSRPVIKIALKTDSQDIARKKAVSLNAKLESYWQDLMDSGEIHETKRFKQAIRIVQQAGFSYLTAPVIAKQPIEEIEARILAIENSTPKQVEAVLGFVPEPEITVNEALELFWGYAKDKTINKTADEIRKWKNPRKKAVKNFVNLCGNKAITKIERTDVLALRDWWIERIENDDLTAQSANKDLIKFKTIITTVNDNLNLGINTDILFKKFTLKVEYEETRFPFETDFINDVLLSDKTLEGLNIEAKNVLYAMADTGARMVELVALVEEDIKLDVPIPYIRIVPKLKKTLKTAYSNREIPLVGYALEAFKSYPKGFQTYFKKADSLSTAVNKYLRENEVFPSEQHSVYSLRHSFQDRLTALDAPDRVQTQLMGHKFKREMYGRGATLEHLREWMDKLVLKLDIQ